MTHVWMNFIAALFTFYSEPEIVETPDTAEYLVIDRFDGNQVILEGTNGTFSVPENMLPAGAKEGEIIEWRIDKAERNKRIAAAQDRIHRMQNMNIIEI